MRRLNRASIVAFSVAATMCFAGAATAQVNGPPASVTSLGFGGHSGSIRGTAPSVTSLGPRGYSSSSSSSSVSPAGNLFGPNRGNINDHHHRYRGYYPWGGYYSGPYYGYDDSASADAPPDDQYNGGPTIFDRRGSGATVPPPTAPAGPSAYSGQDAASAPEAPASNQPQTALIFKDGHELDVANYAIVGNMLFDLTDGHHRKIALADLDLAATSKQNEDRGIDFELPAGAQAN